VEVANADWVRFTSSDTLLDAISMETFRGICRLQASGSYEKWPSLPRCEAPLRSINRDLGELLLREEGVPTALLPPLDDAFIVEWYCRACGETVSTGHSSRIESKRKASLPAEGILGPCNLRMVGGLRETHHPLDYLEYRRVSDIARTGGAAAPPPPSRRGGAGGGGAGGAGGGAGGGGAPPRPPSSSDFSLVVVERAEEKGSCLRVHLPLLQERSGYFNSGAIPAMAEGAKGKLTIRDMPWAGRTSMQLFLLYIYTGSFRPIAEAIARPELMLDVLRLTGASTFFQLENIEALDEFISTKAGVLLSEEVASLTRVGFSTTCDAPVFGAMCEYLTSWGGCLSEETRGQLVTALVEAVPSSSSVGVRAGYGRSFNPQASYAAVALRSALKRGALHHEICAQFLLRQFGCLWTGAGATAGAAEFLAHTKQLVSSHELAHQESDDEGGPGGALGRVVADEDACGRLQLEVVRLQEQVALQETLIGDLLVGKAIPSPLGADAGGASPPAPPASAPLMAVHVRAPLPQAPVRSGAGGAAAGNGKQEGAPKRGERRLGEGTKGESPKRRRGCTAWRPATQNGCDCRCGQYHEVRMCRFYFTGRRSCLHGDDCRYSHVEGSGELMPQLKPKGQ
jgi:hypothetical protein